MIKIEVKTLDVSQRQAKGYTFRTQEGWTELNGERRKVPLALDAEQKPYGIGTYVLGDGSFYIGDFGRLMIGRLELQLVLPQGAVKAA
jgi:hypothetical protein